MPATSWRSHCACSSRCSPAELARLADGPNGFVLPPDPCNQVYPQILLGDASVPLSLSLSLLPLMGFLFFLFAPSR